MWWALAAAGVFTILLGGLSLHDRSVTKKLGKEQAKNAQLQEKIDWYKQALARHNEPDPDLDELDLVSDFQSDPTRAGG